MYYYFLLLVPLRSSSKILSMVVLASFVNVFCKPVLVLVDRDCLMKYMLHVNCRGQAYDSASNMMGHMTGVATQLQKALLSIAETSYDDYLIHTLV